MSNQATEPKQTKVIKVKVLLFTSLKDYLNQAEIDTEIPAGTTIKQLRDQLFSKTNIKLEKLQTLLYAINHNYASLDTVLKDGDEIAFLPMVSGG